MKKILILATLLVILIIIFEIFNNKKSFIYQVKQGSTLIAIAEDLKNKGVIKSKFIFLVVANLKKTHPKYGYYHFNNLWQFLDVIHNYKIATSNITLLPGKTVQEYYAIISSNKNINTRLSLSEIIKSIGIASPIEGRFMPDTYQFEIGTSAKSIFNRSYKLMHKKLNLIWENRIKNKFITTKYKLLILASIIEKESGSRGENAKIAGVFINRMVKNMRLQTDPTVIYALGNKYNGRLTRSDLRVKSPYNTYKIKGLPIGAITNPSISSIVAASRPLKHNLLYFVAKDNKSHMFSKTYKEHRSNINYIRSK